jgi:HNH endonuclease
MRYDCNGRPYVIARKVAGLDSAGEPRNGMVKLHRAVMSVLWGRQLGSDEFVCHRDDDKTNNWPENLYVGDATSNAADSVRNGGRLRGDQHPSTKTKDSQVGEIRLALLQGKRGVDLARLHGVHRSTISRIKHGVRRK